MIGKRTLLNLGMLVLAGGLATVVMLEPGREPEPEPPKLTGLDPVSITKIRIDRPGMDTIALERVADNWRMTEPYTVSANAFKVESLLELVSTTSHAQLAAERLDEFGLEPAKASLRLDDTEFLFGDTESLSHRRYVHTGERIHLTDDRYYHHLRSTPEGFVSLKLLPGDTPVHRILTPEWTLTQAGDGEWALTPEQPNITTDRLMDKADAWRHMQAIQVLKLDEGDSSDIRIEIGREGDPQPLVFLLLESPDELLLTRPDLGLKYRLPESARARLLEPPTAPPEPSSTSIDPTPPS